MNYWRIDRDDGEETGTDINTIATILFNLLKSICDVTKLSKNGMKIKKNFKSGSNIFLNTPFLSACVNCEYGIEHTVHSTLTHIKIK